MLHTMIRGSAALRLHSVIGMTAGLQDVIKSNQVRLDVGIRVRNGVAHPRLGRQVDHDGWLILRKNVVDQGFVGDAALNAICAARRPLVRLPAATRRSPTATFIKVFR